MAGSRRGWTNADRPSPYVTEDADELPKLLSSAVLYVDLLGIREMARHDALGNLRRLHEAITGGRYRDFLHEQSPWPAASFSDMLVVGSPLLPGGDEESAITGLIAQAASLQLTLTQSNFFLRGALTWGDVHIHNGFAFGEALVDAVEIEEHVAVSPRIILDEAADAIMRRSSDDGVDVEPMLLHDADGHTFINYLAVLFDDTDDPTDGLRRHRDVVAARLDAHRDHKRRWEKYRWVAEYHNCVVTGAVEQGLIDADDGLLIPSVTMTWQFDPFTRRAPA
jgi:hypothetical protein